MTVPREVLLDSYPASTPVLASSVLAGLDRRRVLVVLDDDPTGTQSIADLPVLTEWTAGSLEWAMRQGRPAVYVLTNSRSLDPDEAARRTVEVAEAAFAAAAEVGVTVAFVSRSDSTLRGHFPLEPTELAAQIRRQDGVEVDGTVLVPAFPEAGRVTVGGTHYVGSAADGFTPVGETEFATDATFGYRSSDMRAWVEERSGGTLRADDVLAIDLRTLRTDHAAVVALLRVARDAQPIVTDIVDEDDMRRLALAIQEAERRGSRLLFRVGPPFVRALIGQEPPAPLEQGELGDLGGSTATVGGLVVVGSHVSMTTRQLERLRVRLSPTELEIHVAHVLDDRRTAHLSDAVDRAVAALPRGDLLITTTRSVVTGRSAADSLAIARAVSDALAEVVRRVVAARRPRFVVAKGGITSSDVAIRGLGIARALVRGPMLPGLVSLWEAVDEPARGIPFVVFAGNVGGPESLADVVAKFRSTPTARPGSGIR